MVDPKEIRTVKEGATYLVPTFEVIDGEGLRLYGNREIKFVKGDKSDLSKFRQPGFMTETLLTVCKEYLIDVSTGDLRDQETQEAITYIRQAITALHNRAERRKAAGVQGTMKP